MTITVDALAPFVAKSSSAIVLDLTTDAVSKEATVSITKDKQTIVFIPFEKHSTIGHISDFQCGCDIWMKCK